MRKLRNVLFIVLLGGVVISMGVLATAFLAPAKLESVAATFGRIWNSHAGSGQAVKSSAQWPMMQQPVSLIDPVLIELDETTSLGNLGDFDKVGCEGKVYKINIDEGRDARITASASMGPLEYPLWITGGRNVHVLGLELRPIVQPGCDVGEAHQVKDERPNIHPRLVGAKAFRLQQSGTTYIEGVDIDLLGMEADCFAIRNPDDMTPEVAFKERHIVIVNTRCTGIEGLDDSPVGDGIHGDFFQNQGRDDIASLTLENVTYLSSSNGITLHNWNKDAGTPQRLTLRNTNYGWDERYSADDDYEISGLAFTGHGKTLILENVWLNHGKGLNYGIFNGQRLGTSAKSGQIKKHSGLRAGIPPDGDFAPADKTGLEYVSPYTAP